VSAENPVDVALRFVECINRGDLNSLVALMPEDHTFVDLAGDVEKGRQTMKSGWKQYFTACPEYMIHISDIYLVENEVILVGRTTGSHVGLPRQEEIRDPIIWVAKVEAGLVKEWRLYLDSEERRAQLGATETTQVTKQYS